MAFSFTRNLAGMGGLVAGLLYADVAFAQSTETAQTPGGQQRNTTLPPLSSIRPLGALPGVTPPAERKLLHSFKLDVDQTFARSESKAESLPEERDTRQTSLALGFGVGDRAFGQISVSYATNDIESKNSVENGAIDIDAEVSTTTFGLTGGYLVQPYLALGALYMRSENSGSYQFDIAVPENDSSGSSNTYGPFVRLMAPYGDFFFSLTSTYLFNDGKQRYTNNIPEAQDGWARLWLNSLHVSYAVTGDVQLSGGLAWSHVTDQRSMGFEPGLDQDWYIASAGISYALTPALDLRLRASTWLANSKTDYDQVTIGAGYRF